MTLAHHRSGYNSIRCAKPQTSHSLFAVSVRCFSRDSYDESLRAIVGYIGSPPPHFTRTGDRHGLLCYLPREFTGGSKVVLGIPGGCNEHILLLKFHLSIIRSIWGFCLKNIFGEGIYAL